MPGNNQWCYDHWKPIVDESMSGMLASLLLMEAFTSSERVMREAGWDPDIGTLANASKLNDIMLSHLPTCCFLGEVTIASIYDEIRAFKANSASAKPCKRRSGGAKCMGIMHAECIE